MNYTMMDESTNIKLNLIFKGLLAGLRRDVQGVIYFIAAKVELQIYVRT